MGRPQRRLECCLGAAFIAKACADGREVANQGSPDGASCAAANGGAKAPEASSPPRLPVRVASGDWR